MNMEEPSYKVRLFDRIKNVQSTTVPTALQLRGMNMIYEGIKQHGTIVLLPSGALSSMSLEAKK